MFEWLMRWFRRIFWLFLLCVALFAALAYSWLSERVLAGGTTAQPLVVAAGAPAQQVARSLAAIGPAEQTGSLLRHLPGATEFAWWALLRGSGKARSIKSGEYEIGTADTPLRVLKKLSDGEQVLRQITIVEGWNLRQVFEALQKEKRLEQSIPRQSYAMAQKFVAERLGVPSGKLEGRFFPDTYRFATGQQDLEVLRAAALAMDRQLRAAWEKRSSDSVLQSLDQALILASIVEKETGAAADRAEISGVFHNRLRIGMRLQTDPTVIYGLGEAFDGNLRKVDLLTDTPFNTYTRAGLPPTPIAMPGKAALLAATQPAQTNAMYFVARGNGSSQFSATLAEHNRAVDKYIRGR